MTVSLDQMRTNLILAGLPARERELLGSSPEFKHLHLGDGVTKAGNRLELLYFPLDAAISIVNEQDEPQDGRIVEVTVIGKEGCHGATVVQGSEISPSVALVQIAGGAITVPSSSVTSDSTDLHYLRKALARYSLLLYRHSVISVGCSQFHSSAQRVARWLKAHWHRTGLESFPFTTAFFAAQVGISEKTVSEVLDEFERNGILHLERKNITIANQDLLTRRSCTCFHRTKDASDEYVMALQEMARTYGTA